MKAFSSYVPKKDQPAYLTACRSDAVKWVVGTFKEELKRAYTSSQALSEGSKLFESGDWALKQAYQVGYRKALSETQQQLDKLLSTKLKVDHA